MRKILLIGHYGFVNRGCEAIVRGTVTIIRHHLPDAQITLVSRHPELDERVVRSSKIALDRIVPENFPHARYSPQWFAKVAGHRLFNSNLTEYNYVHRERLRSHDLVLSIGGDTFSDDYGIAGAYFSPIDYVKSIGGKAGIWAASIGPFKEPGQSKWAEILKRLDLITVREPLTVEYLAKIGVKAPVHRVADPAFVMQPEKPATGFTPKAVGEVRVGVGISDLLRTNAKYGENYVRESAKFVARLVRTPGLKVLLVPHVVEGLKSTNDYAACEVVAELSGVAREPNLELVPQTYNAAELKYTIGQCDYFIGARTHSTIASLSQQVPTVSIGYSVKAFGINRDLFGHDGYVTPVDNLTEEILMRAYGRLVSEREQIKACLAEKLPSVREQSLKGGEYLSALWR